MPDTSPRPPSRVDLWAARHRAVFLAIAAVSASCAWFILYTRPDDDGPLTWLAYVLAGVAGVVAVWPYMVRKRIEAHRAGRGDD